MAQHWLAIVNPMAGLPRSTRRLMEMENRLRHELGAQVVFTERPGHAMQLAAEARPYLGLAVFGGDGTVSEVVNGMSLKKQRMLLLAGGTGNGLARDLGLTSMDASFAAALAGRFRSLDLIRITFRSKGEEISRLEISTASVGYAAEVVVLSNRYFKWLGPLRYPLAATLQAARQRSFSIGVRLEEKPATRQQLSNVMVNNTRHAGNFSAFRTSRPDDGKMDVLLARAGFIPQVLHNFAVLTQTYLYATAREFTSRALNLSLSTAARLMIDGELWENVSEAKFEILPGVLQCAA
jgi:diacylglycerol kinase family enzyme